VTVMMFRYVHYRICKKYSRYEVVKNFVSAMKPRVRRSEKEVSKEVSKKNLNKRNNYVNLA
jgi:hypothetical protein